MTMATIYIGDHLFANPNAIREGIGRDVVTAIENGRAAGYANVSSTCGR